MSSRGTKASNSKHAKEWCCFVFILGICFAQAMVLAVLFIGLDHTEKDEAIGYDNAAAYEPEEGVLNESDVDLEQGNEEELPEEFPGDIADVGLGEKDAPDIETFEQHEAGAEADESAEKEALDDQDESMTDQDTILDELADGDATAAPQPVATALRGASSKSEGIDHLAEASTLVGDLSLVDSPSCDGMDVTLDSIEIHVIGWRRPKSLYALLNQLRAAPYGGWDKPIPCHIHVDGGADGQVLNTAMAFRWQHGPVRLDVRPENVGLREIWLSSLAKAAKAAGPNSLLVVLEDDMRVSPLYFQWLLRMIRKYGRSPACRNPSLMGFSLSPVRVQEMRLPFKRWRAKYALPPECNEHGGYLSTLPSSWGGSYFTDRWLDFIQFTEVRLKEPYYSVAQEKLSKQVRSYDELQLTPEELFLPGGCRSNVWPNSWKRFMVDFMFGRGAVMIYPNFLGERALATTLQLSGKHVKRRDQTQDSGKDGDDDIDETGDSRVQEPREKDMQRNARVAPLLEGRRGALMELVMPIFADMCVTDVFMEHTTRKEAVEQGARFLGTVRQSGEVYAELVRAWQRPALEPS